MSGRKSPPRSADDDEPLLKSAVSTNSDDLADLDPVIRTKNLTSQNKILKFLVVFFALASVALLVLVAVYRTKPHATPVCETPACVKLAGEIVSAMNTSVDPCDDFYEYACGGWIKSHVLPSYLGRLATFSILDELNKKRLEGKLVEPSPGSEGQSEAVKMAKSLYKSCLDTTTMDEVGAAPVLDLIDEIRGTGTFKVQAAYTTIARQYSATPFFSFDVQPDQKNTARNLITLSQGGLGMDSASYYKLNASDPLVLAYQAFMGSAFGLLGMKNAKELTMSVFALEKRIAAVTAPPAALRDPYAVYNLVTLQSLNAMSPAFDYVALSKALVGPKEAEQITPATQVIVQVPQYMGNVSVIVKSLPVGDAALEAYVIWIAVQPLLPYLSSPFRAIVDVYNKAAQGTSPPARTETCVGLTDATLGYATGRIFIDNYFSEDSKVEVSAMIQSIKTEFKTNVDTLNWMDANTKTLAKAKVDAVLPVIAYPDLIANNTQLDAAYKDYDFNFTCFACSMMMSQGMVRQKELQSLALPVLRNQWEMTADTVNAYYDPNFNNIVFPAGILQAPFYEGDFIMVVKYGGIGAVMGHELTHGFDDQGSQFDKAGNLHKWWPASVYKAFGAKTQCIARQYQNYTLFGKHVNGNLTLGENIADHGGLKMAYDAYQTWKKSEPEQPSLPGLKSVSDDQLFFLAYAQLWCSKSTRQDAESRLLVDPHSPPKYRVIGSLSTSQEFVAAWKCPVGSAMNRADKCVVW